MGVVEQITSQQQSHQATRPTQVQQQQKLQQQQQQHEQKQRPTEENQPRLKRIWNWIYGRGRRHHHHDNHHQQQIITSTTTGAGSRRPIVAHQQVVADSMSSTNNQHVPSQNGEVITYTVPQSGTNTVQMASSASAAMSLLTSMHPGSSPSGTMTIKLSSTPFPGLDNNGTTATVVVTGFPTIEITYHFPSGIQTSPYHPNPGTAYPGTTRVAYLPNTNEGCMLLTRIKYAFRHGHVFSIGRSITTGLDNQVTWSLIPHKTSLSGGPFSFPDSNYIFQANLYCDHMGVPSAAACLMMMNGSSSSTSSSSKRTSSKAFPAVSATTSTSSSNNGSSMPIALPVAIGSNSAAAAASATTTVSNIIPNQTIQYKHPVSLSSSTSMDGILQPLTSACIQDALSHKQECPLCLEELMSDATQSTTCCMIGTCKHRFHNDCIHDALNHHPKCPVCTVPVGKPQGKCPSGTMTIQLNPNMKCPGFDDANGTYTIIYKIPSGIQQSYHEHPGVPYNGTIRNAYIPNTNNGRHLLKRLIYAFQHGLIFRVGTSLTNGMANQVTWASIHHKTNLNYNHTQYTDPHAFPDDNYITNCNKSLDALHVPPANEC